MMENCVTIRELAGWKLDDDEYRPVSYDRAKCSDAQRLIAQRAPFELCNPLLANETPAILAILAQHALRQDLQTEMMGLDWSLDVVDLRSLLAFQRRLKLDSLQPLPSTPHADDWLALSALSFGPVRLPKYEVVVDSNTDAILFRSSNPDFAIHLSGNTQSPYPFTLAVLSLKWHNTEAVGFSGMAIIVPSFFSVRAYSIFRRRCSCENS